MDVDDSCIHSVCKRVSWFRQSTKEVGYIWPGKPDALLAAGMENMSRGVWSVNGTVTSKKTIKLHGLLSGEDFDLTMEPGVKPNTPTRKIVIQARAWICSDGETWHAGSPDDRLIYNWAHVPIMADRRFPAFEKSGRPAPAPRSRP